MGKRFERNDRKIVYRFIVQHFRAYVEIMHTAGGSLGFGEPLGHADFFPNFGRSQPGELIPRRDEHLIDNRYLRLLARHNRNLRSQTSTRILR